MVETPAKMRRLKLQPWPDMAEMNTKEQLEFINQQSEIYNDICETTAKFYKEESFN
jgi:hypothetical protein